MNAPAAAPRLAPRPCACGARLRVASDLDGNRVLLDAAPSTGGTPFLTVIAWTDDVAYVGAPEPGEYVAPTERYVRHVHATGQLRGAA